ncbi:hypothetical protein K438DRAFT_1607983 [Mycena galopus ATCC 62051]|nr:hypothetical protein K438DRAFT_1607983 [Mycena galopus ATCC 62051]
MSSPHSPTAGITFTLSTLQDSYIAEDDSDKSQARASSDSETPGRLDLPQQPQRRQSRGSSFYRSLSWIFGFRDKYSLLNCFIFGGALIGICLARAPSMNPAVTPHLLAPGEWFSFAQPLFKIPLFIHIYVATFGGIGAVFQFIPAIRRRKVLAHRINGYTVLFCLFVAMVCGAIAARRSFGGELNAQGAYYLTALLVVFAGSMGFKNVKRDTRRHRKWMLRMVVYASNVLSARLIAFPARSIITLIGTYYSVFRCDDVINLLRAPETLQGSFPQCVGSDPTSVFVAVHASIHDPPLYVAAATRAAQGSLFH